MANPTKIELGAFAAGAVPPPIEHQYLDFDGVQVDLTGFSTLSMNIEALPSVTGPLGGGTIEFVTDGTDGWVRYTWVADDMAEPSSYTGQMWASNGTNRYESDLFLYTVYDGPGSAP